MKRLNLALILIVTLSGFLCQTMAQTITQDEFLNQLKRVHPLFEKERITAQIEKEEQNSYLGDQDWYLKASANYSHEEPAITFAGPDQTDAVFIEGSIERVFWQTGGHFSASLFSGYAHIIINPLYDVPSDLYQNQIAVSYIHPLMKNRNGFLNRLQYDLKQFDIDFSEVKALETMENFLVGSAEKFLDWVFLTEQKMIIAERLKLSEEELTRTQRKRKAHLVDQADVIRAEDAVRIARQNQMLVESQCKALQAELARLSGNDQILKLIPEFGLYKIDSLIPLEEANSQLRENSRLTKLLKVRLSQLAYGRKGFEETSKPDLSAFVQFNLKRTEDTIGESFLLKRPDAVIGLQFSLPVENRTAESQIIKTELQITQLKKEVENVEISLTSALSNLHIQLSELVNVLNLNREQIESAKERTKEELKLYNQGRGELTFVIQSRDNEQNAKLTYATNALMYHKLHVQYRSLMDQIYTDENNE